MRRMTSTRKVALVSVGKSHLVHSFELRRIAEASDDVWDKLVLSSSADTIEALQRQVADLREFIDEHLDKLDELQ